MMLSMKMSGVAALSKNLDLLRDAIREKLLSKVMKVVLIPIVSSAQAHCPTEVGILRESIGFKISDKNRAVVHGFAGPLAGIKVPVLVHKGGLGLPPFTAIPTRYAHLVEYGHNIVVNGKVVGFVGPKPFMRPAWDSEGGDIAFQRFMQEFDQGLTELCNRLPKVIP